MQVQRAAPLAPRAFLRYTRTRQASYKISRGFRLSIPIIFSRSKMINTKAEGNCFNGLRPRRATGTFSSEKSWKIGLAKSSHGRGRAAPEIEADLIDCRPGDMTRTKAFYTAKGFSLSSRAKRIESLMRANFLRNFVFEVVAGWRSF